MERMEGFNAIIACGNIDKVTAAMASVKKSPAVYELFADYLDLAEFVDAIAEEHKGMMCND